MSEIPNEPASGPTSDSMAQPSNRPTAQPTKQRSNPPDRPDYTGYPDPAIEAFLRSRGTADMAHPGGTLLQHLNRVARRLALWDAAPDVVVAGLCHAAYGTDGFAPSLLDLADRATLTDLIGERAEALVYLYASCDRGATYPRLRGGEHPVFRDRFAGADLEPAEEDLRAFLAITAANELDVFEHNEDLATRYGPGLYRLLASVRALLSPGAWEEVRRALGGSADAPPAA